MAFLIRRLVSYLMARLNEGRSSIQAVRRNTISAVRRSQALLWQRFYQAQYRITIWRSRYGEIAIAASIVLFIGCSAYLSPLLQKMLEPHFSDQQALVDFRSLLLALGSVLVGVAGIAFSLVMFAMQINVERMPHGLFRWFSTDKRILGAFGVTILLAILVACLSLIPDKSRVAIVALTALWGTALIFYLFLYAYRRALLTINPARQLSLIVEDALRKLQAWARRAERAKPLFEASEVEDDKEASSFHSTHEVSRVAYFKLNPHWTSDASKAMQYAISYARGYAEKGDHDVSGTALGAIVVINKAYVEAKGKTFFANYLMSDNSLSTDGFINGTLEHLRQNVRIGLARGDEQQIEQTFQGIAELVRVYIDIDYSDTHADKTHAHLAAGYLSEAVKSVVPHNMPDVVMEGVRLMGQSAHLFLSKGDPNGIATLVGDIGVVACSGIANENYRPITLTGIEQLAKLTFTLIQTDARHIGFAARRLKENVSMVAKLFLAVPDTPLTSAHGTYLGPYYSGTSTQALQSWLTNLVNVLVKAETSNDAAKTVIRNIEDWAEGLYQNEKELLLLAIEKRSNFTLDMFHWMAHVTKLLLALSNAPACDSHTKQKLQKHALWMVYTLSWIPNDKETIAFVESLHMTEILVDVAIDGHHRECSEFSEEVRGLLLGWAFKGGKCQTGLPILERAFYGLATLALTTGSSASDADMKDKISERLSKSDAPDQDVRDGVARNIRRRAATLDRMGHWSSRIEMAMSKVNQGELRPLLEDLASLLSPDTAGEHVDLDLF